MVVGFCGNASLPDKLVCQACFSFAAQRQPQQTITPDMVSVIRQMELFCGTRAAFSAGASTSGPPVQSVDLSPTLDEEGGQFAIPSGFDFLLMDPFILAVRQTLDMEEELEHPSKVRKFFPQLKAERSDFPVLPELQDLVLEEKLALITGFTSCTFFERINCIFPRLHKLMHKSCT